MNELATIDPTQLPSTRLGSAEDYAELTKGGDFLSTIKLCTSDKYVKKNLIPNGHFGIPRSKEEIDDLGDVIDVLPLASRAKAVDMSDLSAVVANYDASSEAFKDIAARSKVKDSGCVAGVSFLVIERSTGQFFEYFFGSSSSHREAKLVLGCCPLSQVDIDAMAAAGADVDGLEPHTAYAVTIRSKYIDKTKYQWYGPVATRCSQPFAKLPSATAILREIDKFVNVKSGGAVKVTDNRKQRAR